MLSSAHVTPNHSMLKYFWYHRPEDEFPPPSILRPEQLGASDRLRVACTQTTLSSARQRGLVQEWCRLLPSLHHVRFLWLNSKVPQMLFDAACELPSLEGLWIKWSGVRNIDALQGLKTLRYFHLGSSSALTAINALSQQRQLRWLGLENLKQITDVGPLAALTELEGLTLEGSIWSTQRILSLAPIGKLRSLRYLALANLRADDSTLAPLFTLKKLETFIVAKWWDEHEVAEIRKRNPGLVA